MSHSSDLNNEALRAAVLQRVRQAYCTTWSELGSPDADLNNTARWNADDPLTRRLNEYGDPLTP